MSLHIPAPVLLTGASGFVGRHLAAGLGALGVPFRCGSRDPESAGRRWPDGDWVELDVERPETLAPALSGCRSAVYLVHGMGGDADYAMRERAAAEGFAVAAASSGVERLVYLGGVEPAGEPSRHLASRLETGEILRGGPVIAVEIRAAMIVGEGSESWQIVKDLALRLPAMILPRWLRNRSCPVLVDDVVVALVSALAEPVEESHWMDCPGPDVVTHRDLLRSVARERGHRPLMVDVPVLTPRLSSYWLALVTDADYSLARELVAGLTSDLLPRGPQVWDRIPGFAPTGIRDAIRLALADSGADWPTEATSRRIAGKVRARAERGVGE